jgi:drug/metabolite transporter (DMT)-like permease
MTESAEKKSPVILIAILAIIWGSSFILMKRALNVYTPLQIGSLRIFVAFIALLPYALNRIRTIERRKWKFFILSGFAGNGIPSVLFPLAETHISSAVAGMINSLTPIFTLIVGVMLYGMKVGRGRVLGLFVGLIGAVLLLSGNGADGSLEINMYAIFIVLATICYAFSVNTLRYKLADTDAITNTAFALMCAGIPMGTFLFTTDFIPRTFSSVGSLFAIVCILLLGLFSTALSTVLFNRVIKTSGALSAASITYLIPIVALLWGFYDHENLSIVHIAGLGAILVGVYIVNRKA